MLKQLGLLLAAGVGTQIKETVDFEMFKDAIINHPDFESVVPIICDALAESTSSPIVASSAAFITNNYAEFMSSSDSSTMKLFSKFIANKNSKQNPSAPIHDGSEGVSLIGDSDEKTN